jgi:uncharacterized protein (UPF0147 family)
MVTHGQIEEVTEAFNLLLSESGVPKNIRTRMSALLAELGGCEDLSITVNKILNELEDLSNDVNIQPFVRTQLWNIASMLETI